MTDSNGNEPYYTPTEVGTLIESFRHDMSLIAEKVNWLSEDVRVLKEDVTDIKVRLRTVEDVIRITIPTINRRLDRLEAKTGIQN